MRSQNLMNRRAFLQEAALKTGAVVVAGGALGPLQTCFAGNIALGIGVSLQGKRIFPADNPWNRDISKDPVDPNSETLIAGIGPDKHLHPDFGTFWNNAPSGMSYIVVPGNQAREPVRFEYADESDPGPYPIPPEAPIEGGANAPADSDRHVLVIDRDNWKLYETWQSFKEGNGWKAGSGAVFDLNSNKLRPAGWTSADAAGLPIFPGLVRYDEVVEQKAVYHALRFTCRKTCRGYVSPARHWASRSHDSNLPPMGMRVRLKASYDLSRFPATVQVLLTALKKYGLILADNGGDWFISGAHDPRWNDEELSALKRVKGGDLEVVRMEEIVTG
ncbi:MAG: hypothetical protein HY318_16655 [Armatimonadetes bacterium]|nr:hypothetical protein [Armatimonadota bacterium]